MHITTVNSVGYIFVCAQIQVQSKEKEGINLRMGSIGEVWERESSCKSCKQRGGSDIKLFNLKGGEKDIEFLTFPLQAHTYI